jgi:hypothetical protein
MTWYDMQDASWDAVHVINASATDAAVQVYVGGALKSTITVNAGQAAYVTYLGLIADRRPHRQHRASNLFTTHLGLG